MSDGKVTIGIIEDPYILKAELVDLLKKAGYEPLVVARAEDPLKKFEAAKPKVIITDRDPATSDHRFGLINDVRENATLKEVEIFFYSDNLDVKDEVALRRLKVNSFFLKSADPATVVEGIRLFLNPPKEETYQDWEDELLNRGTVYVDRPVQVPGAGAPPPPSAPAAPPQPGATPSADPLAGGGGGGIFGASGGADDNMGGVFDSIFGTDDTDKSAKGHFDLGSALFSSKIWDQALVELRMASNSARYATESHLMMGKSYRELGKLADAVRSFQAGQKLAPPDEKNAFTFELAITMEQGGKPTDAFRALASLQGRPELPRSQRTAGQTERIAPRPIAATRRRDRLYRYRFVDALFARFGRLR